MPNNNPYLNHLQYYYYPEMSQEEIAQQYGQNPDAYGNSTSYLSSLFGQDQDFSGYHSQESLPFNSASQSQEANGGIGQSIGGMFGGGEKDSGGGGMFGDSKGGKMAGQVNYAQAAEGISEIGKNGQTVQTPDDGSASTTQKLVGSYGVWGQAISQVSQIGTRATIGTDKSDLSNALGTGIFNPSRNLNAWSDNRMDTSDKIMSQVNPFYYGIVKAQLDRADQAKAADQAHREQINAMNERQRLNKLHGEWDKASREEIHGV